MKFDEYEYLRNDMLIKEKEWEEMEYYYEQEKRKQRLPAIIKILVPGWVIKENN